MIDTTAQLVNYEGEPCGVARVPQFSENEEGLSQALSYLGLTKLINRLNAQVLTDEMNRIREICKKDEPSNRLLKDLTNQLLATEWHSRLQAVLTNPIEMFKLEDDAREAARQKWKDEQNALIEKMKAEAVALKNGDGK